MNDATVLEMLLALCLGLGLAASCGFRVFVPLLIISLAGKAEMLTLSDGFEWMDSWPAIAAFGAATLLEVGGYYLPWLDNLLDTVSTPAAVIAGIISVAASVADMDPLLKWSLAVIAGGGAAGVIHVGTVAFRALSTTTTGGLANPLVATAEWVMALVLSLMAVVVPVLAAIVALCLLLWLGRCACRLWCRVRQPALAAPGSRTAGTGKPLGKPPGESN
jgi:hypothetical protein